MKYLASLQRILGVALLGLALGLGSALADPGDPPATTVTIEPEGNQLKFATTEFTVEAGQTVKLVFDNTATSPAMQHNVLVLNTTDDSVVNRVGQAALSASDFVPDDDAIVAATDVAKPGETVEVTFTVPSEPGTYTYVCTFPGHYVSMQGTMVVK